MSDRDKKRGIGEWTRTTDGLWTKSKVLRIASLLGEQLMLPLADKISGQMLMRHATCSALFRVFITVNRHARAAGDGTPDAILSDIYADNYLDIIADMPGLQAAMEAVEWAVWDRETRELRFPDYLKYNNLMKNGKRGRPGNPDSPDAQRKRKKREQEAGQTPPDNSRTNAGQIGAERADKSVRREADIDADEKKNPESLFLGEIRSPEAMQLRKDRVDALTPAWTQMRGWTPMDETTLVSAASNLDLLTAKDWLVLKWFFKRAVTHPEQCEGGVTSYRRVFLEGLEGYLARATRVWKQCGSPRLEPRVFNSVPQERSGATEVEPEMSAEERTAAARRWRQEALNADNVGSARKGNE